ncbi:MAG: hypothetical protein R2693_07255 [Nocardioidaceae bacterium]
MREVIRRTSSAQRAEVDNPKGFSIVGHKAQVGVQLHVASRSATACSNWVNARAAIVAGEA